jgi:hypothetical protein
LQAGLPARQGHNYRLNYRFSDFPAVFTDFPVNCRFSSRITDFPAYFPTGQNLLGAHVCVQLSVLTKQTGGTMRRRNLTNSNTSSLKRWTRLGLAELWDRSDRDIDRMRKDGRLSEPIGYIGRSPIWSDEQRLAAEQVGLAAHQAKTA